MLSNVFTPLSEGFCQEESKTLLLALAAEDTFFGSSKGSVLRRVDLFP